MRYVVLLAPIAALAAASPPRAQTLAAAGPVPTVTTLTRQEFEALPPNALIEVDGERMTKQDFTARRLHALRDAVARAPEQRTRAETSFEARRGAFFEQQKAALARANEKVQLEIDRLRAIDAASHGPNWDVRRKEAGDLLAQAASASPTERTRLEKQASDLLTEVPASGQ